MVARLKRGFGWDVEREREIPWRLARKLRLPLSKWLRIGQEKAQRAERACGNDSIFLSSAGQLQTDPDISKDLELGSSGCAR